MCIKFSKKVKIGVQKPNLSFWRFFMSRNRRTAAASAIFTDKGFYAILAASVIMVCLAAFLAFSWSGEEIQEPELPDGKQSLSLDEVLPEGYVPDWPVENPSASVGTTETDIPDDKANSNSDENEEPANEPETVTLQLIQPVEEAYVVAVNGFSGSTPVFSESMGDWRLHQGVDFLTETSVNVMAAESGIVEDVYDDGLMGTTVLLLHAYEPELSISPWLLIPRSLKVCQ